MRLMGAPYLPDCKVDQDLAWASCCRSIKQLWNWCPPAVPLPPLTEKPADINAAKGGFSKRHPPICALKQASASKIEEELPGGLIAYTNGAVIPDTGSATAASSVMPALGWTAFCRLPFVACSTTAEMTGLHLTVELLAANPPTRWVVLPISAADVASFPFLNLSLSQFHLGCESTAPRNIVAADVTSQDCLEELLGVTERGGIPVSARIPADRGYSTGHLNGVEGDLADHRLLQGIESSVSEVSTVQGRNAVTLRFAGPVPPRAREPHQDVVSGAPC
ncbi:hypothetical protein HPB51_029053 [Rhipicephalus microplus]|uniref:Uncharacterized protein n=1 Tax=Rhipicephalus microplus TaxID=6941 RepID=A0A9J6CV81_RHIMP|nr:hypothetical protein HPB51_029053 [Rhipicephalus microplus]